MWYVFTEIALLLLLALLLGLLVGWLLWRRGRVSMSRRDHQAMTEQSESLRNDRDKLAGENTSLNTELRSVRDDAAHAHALVEDRDRQLVERDRELVRLRARPAQSPSSSQSSQSSQPLQSSQTAPVEPRDGRLSTAVPAGAGWALSSNDRSEDDLQEITGIGPDMESLLRRNGIRTHRQLANLSRSDVDLLQAQLSDFPGRIRNDNWVGQARDLSIKAGTVTEDDRRRWWSF